MISVDISGFKLADAVKMIPGVEIRVRGRLRKTGNFQTAKTFWSSLSSPLSSSLSSFSSPSPSTMINGSSISGTVPEKMVSVLEFSLPWVFWLTICASTDITSRLI
jgi:hypothetical protein